MFDLSSPVLTNMPLPADTLRDYTLEFEIRVERALADLKECLREVIRDRDCSRELFDMLMEDIEEISSVQEHELITLRAELDRKGLAPLGTEVECVQLRSQVTSLKDELAARTQRFATLDHTWDEERAILEVGRVVASSRANDLALELLQAKSYIHFTLDIEYRREGDKPSRPQQAFRCLQTESAEREEALRVAIAEVGTLQALLEIERQSSTSDPTMERELVHLWHSHQKFKKVARNLGFNVAGLLHTHAQDDPILHTSFGRLCQAVSERLGHV